MLITISVANSLNSVLEVDEPLPHDKLSGYRGDQLCSLNLIAQAADPWQQHPVEMAHIY